MFPEKLSSSKKRSVLFHPDPTVEPILMKDRTAPSVYHTDGELH